MLRRALARNLNQGGHGGALDQAEARALGWLEKASRPVSALEDDAVVCDVLDALAVNLDGRAAAPGYFSRRRRVLHKMLGYAVRKKRLDKNPVSKGNLPEGWSPTEGAGRRGRPAVHRLARADRRNAHRVQRCRAAAGT